MQTYCRPKQGCVTLARKVPQGNTVFKAKQNKKAKLSPEQQQQQQQEEEEVTTVSC